jgi:hypothetical protein
MQKRTAGQKYGVDSDEGSQSLKGENSLKHGTAGDHYVRSKVPGTAVSDVIYDQCRGPDSRTAAGHKILELNYVRRDLPGCETSP